MESKMGKETSAILDEKKDKAKQIDLYANEVMKCPMDKQAYEIAKEHLGSSFCIPRSNGFKDWENK